MKKLNHIWVFSDGIKGHEIQSLTLAYKIAMNVKVFQCALRQPWLSFAPRILPGFGKHIIWNKKNSPKMNQQPDAIITCGRRMAAVGKYFKRKLHIQHIQILNPGDNKKNYDVLICPKHDQLQGENIISSLGSLHNVSHISLNHMSQKCKKQKTLYNNLLVSVFIGNPSQGFFKSLDNIAKQIDTHFPNHKLAICGSRRTKEQLHKAIKHSFKKAEICWLSEKDGDNPYQCLLACSNVLIVTADSINMVSEACASDKSVIVIGKKYVSPKHKRFIFSMKDRLSEFDDQKREYQPIDIIKDVAKAVLHKLQANSKN